MTNYLRQKLQQLKTENNASSDAKIVSDFPVIIQVVVRKSESEPAGGKEGEDRGIEDQDGGTNEGRKIIELDWADLKSRTINSRYRQHSSLKLKFAGSGRKSAG